MADNRKFDQTPGSDSPQQVQATEERVATVLNQKGDGSATKTGTADGPNDKAGLPDTASENIALLRSVNDAVEKRIVRLLERNPNMSRTSTGALYDLYWKSEAANRGLVRLAKPAETAALFSERLANWEVKGFEDAMKGSAQRPPEVIQSLVLKQSPTLVSSLPRGLKSLSWLQACIEAPAKKAVWGHFAAPNVENSLFIETEDPPWLVEARIRWIAKGLGLKEDEPLPGFHYVCPGPFDLVKEAEELERLILNWKPAFLVLSTLQNILGGRNWKEPDEMYDVSATFVRLSRLYCPIIVITHSPWDRAQRRAAGTVTFTANFPTTLHYEKFEVRKTTDTTVHVLLDSKVGAGSEFYLDLTVEPDLLGEDPRSVHVVYGGRGRPKGSGKDAIRAVIEDDPN